jgi:phosphoribosyl-AMP cyclohydrolase
LRGEFEVPISRIRGRSSSFANFGIGAPVSTSFDSNDIEEGLSFRPKFDASGLVTCVATDAATSEVLMVAHMNEEALRKTIATGEAWYYSRSRQALWRKGETSGHVQRVVEMRADCDQDAIWIRVEQTGAACHTGRHSCFYRRVEAADGGARLSFVDADKVFDPKAVYRK